MISSVHLFEFNEGLECISHDKRVFAGATEPNIVGDVVQEYLPRASPLRMHESWYTKDDGKVIDRCDVRNYYSRTERKTVIVLTFGVPVQEWDEEDINPYILENNSPVYIDGYLNKFEPRVDVEAYTNWLATLSAIDQDWSPSLRQEEFPPLPTEEEMPRLDESLRSTRLREWYVASANT